MYHDVCHTTCRPTRVITRSTTLRLPRNNSSQEPWKRCAVLFLLGGGGDLTMRWVTGWGTLSNPIYTVNFSVVECIKTTLQKKWFLSVFKLQKKILQLQYLHAPYRPHVQQTVARQVRGWISVGKMSLTHVKIVFPNVSPCGFVEHVKLVSTLKENCTPKS